MARGWVPPGSQRNQCWPGNKECVDTVIRQALAYLIASIECIPVLRQAGNGDLLLVDALRVGEDLVVEDDVSGCEEAGTAGKSTGSGRTCGEGISSRSVRSMHMAVGTTAVTVAHCSTCAPGLLCDRSGRKLSNTSMSCMYDMLVLPLCSMCNTVTIGRNV
jgi:hypothetical protein